MNRDQEAALERLCALFAGEAPSRVLAGGWLAVIEALEREGIVVRVDWKESPREVGPLILRLLRRAAPDAKRPRWSGSELEMDLDEFLFFAGKKLAPLGFTLVSFDTGGDEYALALVANARRTEAQELAKACGFGDIVPYDKLLPAPIEKPAEKVLRTKVVASYAVGRFDQRMDVLGLPGRKLVVFDDRTLYLLAEGTTSSVALPTIESARADRLRRGGALFSTATGFGVFLRERVLLWRAHPTHPIGPPDVDLELDERAMSTPQTLADGRVVERAYYVETASLLDPLEELWVVVTDTYRKMVGTIALADGRAAWSRRPAAPDIAALRSLAERLDRTHGAGGEDARALATDGSDNVVVRSGGRHEVRTIDPQSENASVLRASKDHRRLFVFDRARGKSYLTLFSPDGGRLGNVSLTRKSIAPVRVEPGWMVADVHGADLWIGGHGATFGAGAYACLEIR